MYNKRLQYEYCNYSWTLVFHLLTQTVIERHYILNPSCSKKSLSKILPLFLFRRCIICARTAIAHRLLNLWLKLAKRSNTEYFWLGLKNIFYFTVF